MNKYMSKSLYQIKSDYLEIFRQIEESEGEIPPEINEALVIGEQELKDKAINYAFFIKNLDNDNKIIDSEISRLKELKARNELKIEALDKAIVGGMRMFGVDKIESATLKLSLRKTKSINITNEDKLSDNFFTRKTTKTVSKSAIKEAIESGVIVDGAEIATNFNLQIK